ncbi:hypothetical protein [Arcobacter peruensis]|uniref:hypothetical protein n=1 Tax=Arcobacter peruensis TaxID=2320140 RepID=UPI000F0748CD|nr:hypothetical protein [Arcobacter peruensis]
MKKITTILTMTTLSLMSLNAASLSATFADDIWKKTAVPKTEVCSNFNTKAGSTPSINLENIPANTDKIMLTFSDETFSGMRDGGHGIVSYAVPTNSSSLTIPSMQGETFTLPVGFTSVVKHRGEKYKKTPGAYLAPCSGGKGNTYSVVIKAMSKDKILDATSLTLGIF